MKDKKTYPIRNKIILNHNFSVVTTHSHITEISFKVYCANKIDFALFAIYVYNNVAHYCCRWLDMLRFFPSWLLVVSIQLSTLFTVCNVKLWVMFGLTRNNILTSLSLSVFLSFSPSKSKSKNENGNSVKQWIKVIDRNSLYYIENLFMYLTEIQVSFRCLFTHKNSSQNRLWIYINLYITSNAIANM